MSSINLNHSRNLQEGLVVSVGPSLSEDLERQDPSIENVEEKINSDKFDDGYRFLRLLHSYQTLEQSQQKKQGSVIASLIQVEKQGVYQALLEIAEKYPEWQCKLPPDPYSSILR